MRLCRVSPAKTLHLKIAVGSRQGGNGGYLQFVVTWHRSYFFNDRFDTQPEARDSRKRKFPAGEKVNAPHAQAAEDVTPEANFAPDRTPKFIFPGQLVSCGQVDEHALRGFGDHLERAVNDVVGYYGAGQKITVSYTFDDPNQGGLCSVDISFDDRSLKLTAPSVSLTTRLIEGKFPNVDPIIPRDNDKSLQIDRERMINSLKIISFMSSEKIKPVKMTLNPSHVSRPNIVPANPTTMPPHGHQRPIGRRRCARPSTMAIPVSATTAAPRPAKTPARRPTPTVDDILTQSVFGAMDTGERRGE